MWPALFGSGWILGTLVAVALLCFVAGILGFLYLITVKPPRPGSDELDRAWHRYEEGDLTRFEWERQIGGRRVRQKRKGLTAGRAAGAGPS